MLKSKSYLTCSYCSKIYKDRIELPCEDCICREHLIEPNAVQQNKIKCAKCQRVFEVKNADLFKSNKSLKQLVDDKSYLSEEETNLTQQLEESIREFVGFFEEFIKHKSIVETQVFDHFQEIRFQIDERREEMKKKIDDIALTMIDKAK